MTGGPMDCPRLVSRNAYHHMGHIFFSSVFHTARVVWVLSHNQAVGGVCNTVISSERLERML